MGSPAGFSDCPTPESRVPFGRQRRKSLRVRRERGPALALFRPSRAPIGLDDDHAMLWSKACHEVPRERDAGPRLLGANEAGEGVAGHTRDRLGDRARLGGSGAT